MPSKRDRPLVTPGGMALYLAGLQEGYAARCREEAERWQTEAAVRVFVGGQFWERPLASDLRDERESIMREAHAAGLHEHRPRMCPLCGPVMRRADLDAAEAAVTRGRAALAPHRFDEGFDYLCTRCGGLVNDLRHGVTP
jgi:hypothetical protein